MTFQGSFMGGGSFSDASEIANFTVGANDFASTLSAEPAFFESRRHPSVTQALENRPSETRIVPASIVEAAYDWRLNRSLTHLQRMQQWKGEQLGDMAAWMRPHLPFGALGAGPSDGAEIVDQLRNMLTAALQEMQDLPASQRDVLGQNMLMTRAANVSAELGFAVTPRDLASTAMTDLLWATSLAAGQQGSEALTNDYNGRQIATAYKSQGEPVSSLGKVAAGLQQIYGVADNPDWSATLSGLTGMAAISEKTGMRGLVESIFGGGTKGPGGTTGQWLNAQTLGKAVGAIRKVTSAIQSARPGTIVTSIGAGIAMVGALVPMPAGAIVSAIGAVISLIGALIDWLMGAPPPPPKFVPCKLAKTDAWACLRVFLAAQPANAPYHPGDNISAMDLWNDGWDVQVDMYTGEVLVKVPGSSLYRRILDLFDRATLAKSFQDGKLHEWIRGKIKIADAFTDPAEGKGVWCSPLPNDVVGRYICADYASSARRFRVHTKNDAGDPVDEWTGHGPKAIGWEQIGRSPGFNKEYRAAVLASAFLGGTMPYGRVVLKDGGGVCTGVGGSYEGKVTDGTFTIKRPIMCRWDETSQTILMIEPTPRPKDVTSDGGKSRGETDRQAGVPLTEGSRATYRAADPFAGRSATTTITGSVLQWKTHGKPFYDFARRVLEDGAWRSANRIPSNSPKAVDAPSVDLRAGATTTSIVLSKAKPGQTLVRPGQTVVQPRQTGTGTSQTGIKRDIVPTLVWYKNPLIWAGIGGGVVVASTGGYLLYRKLRKP